MRLFVAVFPPAHALEHLSTLVEKLPLTRRVVPPDRWHVTLAFLGEVEPDQEPAARQALDAVAANPPGARVGELTIAGGGHFGPVVWAGIEGDIDGLTRLSRAVRRELRARRLHPDDKRFKPHLTLARSDQDMSTSDYDRLRNYRGPAWPVAEIVLLLSVTGPRPAYHPLATWRLD